MYVNYRPWRSIFYGRMLIHITATVYSYSIYSSVIRTRTTNLIWAISKFMSLFTVASASFMLLDLAFCC